MDSQVELLLTEVAKPVDRMQKSVVLGALSSIDGSNPETAPVVYFLLESLFQFVTEPGSTLSLKDLVREVLGNPSLAPVLYQVSLPQPEGDHELDQMLAFLHSFRR
jgi:hypothetical protein